MDTRLQSSSKTCVTKIVPGGSRGVLEAGPKVNMVAPGGTNNRSQGMRLPPAARPNELELVPTLDETENPCMMDAADLSKFE